MKKLIVNLGLLISVIFTIFSGLLIQIEYHMGNHTHKLIDKSVIGLDYSDWSSFHKFAIVMLTVFVAIHFSLHWKWYKTVFTKRLLNKNRQVITLSIIFLFVAVTGFVPWIIDLADGNDLNRKAFIEIHDKIAIILSIYFILHIIKRFKWFVSTIEKMNKNTAHNTRS